MAQIDTTALDAALGAYMRKNNDRLNSLLRQKVESEMFMTDVAGVQDEYVEAGIRTSELLQPFQCDWTPKGDVTLTPMVVKVRQIKIDMEIDCTDNLFRTWAGWLADEGKDRKDWPITSWIVEKEMIPKIQEELETLIIGQGVYAAPIPGTPGAAQDSVDGFLTVIADSITAGDITPIASGAFTPSTIFANVESFVKGIPAKYRKKGYTLLMSDTNAFCLWQDYRDTHGGDTNFTGRNFTVVLGNTTIKVQGLVSMEGSDRFVYTAKDNFLRCYDVINMPNAFRIEERLRKLFVYVDFKRGYGFRIAEEVFVNDQA